MQRHVTENTAAKCQGLHLSKEVYWLADHLITTPDEPQWCASCVRVMCYVSESAAQSVLYLSEEVSWLADHLITTPDEL
ncbi:hypothetical protein PLICRDRAFT_48882 [Plicaturopsis crispa FD-325 SS-3]|nr:hypothetical protein PLICRDRAFT_48882 [Plicaturopsis crispa FD-325 SS-3]